MAAIQNTHIAIKNGVPVVIGTAFKVADVAAIYVFGESPIDWIVENYPLTRAQIHAALSYYYDHQDEIQQHWREVEQLAREIGISAEEGIARMRARQQQQKPDSDQ